MLTLDRLKELLHYNPDTGSWTWQVDRTHGVKAGDRAGWFDGRYWRISVDGKRYRSSHLAWLYVTGGVPPCDIDHEDTDTRNERWLNLRLASDSQNQANRNVFKNNVLGIKGVRKVPRCDRYQARIYINGASKHLGCFATTEEAAAAYLNAAQAVHGEFARA